MSHDEKTISEHGLTPDEYAEICRILGRDPNLVELGVFAVMWSEHCSYKSSRVHLKTFPTTGPQVVCGPGENAGIVDLGDGLCAVFKMESHNHPSFIEPYQGAATGVGGILRDVFTMGARPVALLDSLRFGSIDAPKTVSLVHGVVAGIAGYGNCMGIPTVGGETRFDASFNGNNLVNAFCVGVVRLDKIFLAKAAGIGNPVIYLGAKTGRDGIHGATMASAEFDEASEEKRPTVQVGDPFTEKRLLEACLELMAGGDIIGIQDMGAAGLTCSSLEMAGKGDVGIELHLDQVPCREEGMTPYEMMLSESQERMLLVARQGSEDRVREIFAKWDLDAAVVGRIVEGDRLKVYFHGELVADLPTQPITEKAPVYQRPMARPLYLDKAAAWDEDGLPEPDDNADVLLSLLSDPSMASKRWIYRQFDHMVGTDTVVRPGSDAAIIRLKGTGQDGKSDKGLAIAVDCNSRYCLLEPKLGAMHAVAEAARNLVCSGAQPLALTDCLNFGNPENPEIMWQFQQAVEGMGEACRALDTPVVSGNVSFYNETQGRGIDPTPSVGVVGLLPNVEQACQQMFEREGDKILLLGWQRPHLGATDYLEIIHGLKQGQPPGLDLAQERLLQDTCRELIARAWIRSAHDISGGGLAVALALACVSHEERSIGATVELPGTGRSDRRLFGETASAILLSVDPAHEAEVLAWAEQQACPIEVIGTVGGSNLRIDDDNGGSLDLPLDKIADCWWNGLERALGESSSESGSVEKVAV